MAGNLSNYAENAILNHVLGTTAYVMPAQLYIALFTTDPTDAGTGTEVAGNAYVRQLIDFAAAANGSATNSNEVLFPVATGSWGTITHIGLYDATTAGNIIWHGPVGTQKVISAQDQYKVSAGNLTVSLD